jgi:hypothetical protein
LKVKEQRIRYWSAYTAGYKLSLASKAKDPEAYGSKVF